MNNLSSEDYLLSDIQDSLFRALQDFIDNDVELLKLDADERAITPQISNYLKKYFHDFNVDCEYNRLGEVTKTIDGGRVRPDIIIHHRNTEDNLLVIEAKKGKGSEDDRRKLKEFTKKENEFGYLYGVSLVLNIKNPEVVKMEWYIDGDLMESKTVKL